jgi:hypothetical protein
MPNSNLPCLSPAGWATIRFTTTTTSGASLPFLDTCVAESQTGGVLVSEDCTASISMLASNSCGQLNGKVDDISGTVPTAFTTPDPNFAVGVVIVSFKKAATRGVTELCFVDWALSFLFCAYG